MTSDTKTRGKGEPKEGDGCGKQNKGSTGMNEDEDKIADAVEVFTGLLHWIGSHPFHCHITQRKVIAALIVIAPSSMSEHSVAKVCRRLGISRQTMDAACRRFKALLPIQVSGRRSPMQRGRIARGVKAWHKAKNGKGIKHDKAI